MTYFRGLSAALCVLISPTLYASAPLVEFIQKPSSIQLIAPGQRNLIFYTLRNNTAVTFPLSVNTTSPYLRLTTIGNSCGARILAKSTCVMAFAFTAPALAQNVNVGISVNYQGRIPLTDIVGYNVNAGIHCNLQPSTDYQTPFCQQQYQNLVRFTPDVFNVSNQNVRNGQTLGGMIGIYQHTNRDVTCFISCGLRALNGTPPNGQTVFELASVTKTFTGAILGEKSVQNTVNPLDAVLPNLPNGSWLGESYNLHPNMQPVTYQQLATFAGGVCFSDAPNVVLTNTTLQKQSDFVKDINLLNRTSPTCLGTGTNVRAEYGDPNYLPSHNFYSNSSVGLLAQVLMHIDGYTEMDQADFNAFICRHITTPLEMHRTNACLPAEAHSNTCTQTGNFCDTAEWSSTEYAEGYHLTAGQYEPGAPFPFVPWAGAGVLRSNVEDMLRYARANLGLTPSTAPDVVELMQGMKVSHAAKHYLPAPATPRLNIGSQKPLRGGQGFAWVCDPDLNQPGAICGKIGGHPNFRSFIGFSPSKRYGIVLLFNTGDIETNGSLATQLPSIADIGTNMIKAG